MEGFGLLPPAKQQAILNGPAQAPPDGTLGLGGSSMYGNIVGIVLVTIFTTTVTALGLMRLYTKMVLTKKLHVEDYAGFVSFIPYYATVWLYVLLIREGDMLVHQWDMTLGQFLNYLRLLIYFRVTYCLITIFAKTAILLEWYRIFVPNRSRSVFFWAVLAVGIINFIIYVLAMILTLVSCVPTEKIWMPWIDGRCFSRDAADITGAWSNLVTDLAILILPQREIWKLHLSTRRKIGVSLIFSVGLLVVAAAVVRVYANTTLDYDDDVAYSGSVLINITFGEMTGVMIVFCVPGVPKIFTQPKKLKRIFSSFRSWTRLTGDSSSSSRIPSASADNLTEDGRLQKSGMQAIMMTEQDSFRTEVEANKDFVSPPSRHIERGAVTVTTVQRQEERNGHLA